MTSPVPVGKFLIADASNLNAPLKPSSLPFIDAPVVAASTTRFVSSGVIACKELVPVSASFVSAISKIPFCVGVASGSLASGTVCVLPVLAKGKILAST